ncbi:hypothetical protein MLD38_019703 [Melastoma candidum]|uniref:Uncharacterized protein n=1 Tax=Melastoma candidum TaxID=119954 RepID=A0ACB9QZQ2_9MYRT|nr:hypothetical protein MLD38_019703 [Melastoma candidum]
MTSPRLAARSEPPTSSTASDYDDEELSAWHIAASVADGEVVTLSRHAFNAFARIFTSCSGLSVERFWYRKRQRPGEVENASFPSSTNNGKDEWILRLDAMDSKIGSRQKGEFDIHKDKLWGIRISQSNMPSRKRSRSVPLLECTVQEEQKSPHHRCLTEEFSRLSDGNASMDVLNSQKGGYGTVYRAQRKNDGAIVAIKCPHAKANQLHVTNELQMLERG